MDLKTLEQGIADGTYTVTRLAPAKPRRRDLVMTRVAAGKSFALPSYKSVRDSSRTARGAQGQGLQGKRSTKQATRKA